MSAEIIQFRIERQDDGELRVSDVELGCRPASLDCVDERPAGYSGDVVYFLWGESTNLVKIGYTNDVRARLKSFSCGSAEATHLLRLIPGGRMTEKRLHRVFRTRRVRGEWFRFHPEMLTAFRGEDCIRTEADIREGLEQERAEKERAENALRDPNAGRRLADTLASIRDAGEFGYTPDDVNTVLDGSDDYAVACAQERMRECRVGTYLQAAFHEIADSMVREDVDCVAEQICNAVKRYADALRPHYAKLQAERAAEAQDFINRVMAEVSARGY